MRKKRKCHEGIIEKNKAREYTDEHISLFKQNMYSIQTDIFKKSDENESDNEESGSEDDEDGTFDQGNMNGNSSMAFDNEEFSITISNNDDVENGESSGKKGIKRKKDGVSKKVQKRLKQTDVIDKENFIPYKPKNFHTDKGYFLKIVLKTGLKLID